MGGVLSCLRNLLSSTSTSGGVSHPSSIVVNGNTVRLHRLLGEGGYAFVFAGTHVNDATGVETKVAVKRFVVRDAEVLSNVMTEIELHRRLGATNHPNIVAYIDHQRTRGADANPPGSGASGSGTAGGVSRSSLIPSEEDVGASGDVWLVMEIAAGGLRDEVDTRLADFAQAAGSTGRPLAPFTAAEIRKIIADTASGVGALHAMRPPAAHHDVKLENILVSATGRYQLCDFGSARRHSMTCKTAMQVNKAEAALDATMTMLYRPPEACDLWQGVTVDTQADLWAIGVILYALLAGKMPFDPNPRQILALQYEPLPEALRENPEYAPLCELCTQGLLVQDPSQRMNIDGLTQRLHELDAALLPSGPTRLGDVRRAMPAMS